MKKKTTDTKHRGRFSYTGMHREWEIYSDNMSYDICQLYDCFDEKNNEFERDLLYFVEKSNIKFRNVINNFLEEEYLDITIHIKPSEIMVEYNPLATTDYPKKEWGEFYGKFKIDKVNMLKFLNKQFKKCKKDIRDSYLKTK